MNDVTTCRLCGTPLRGLAEEVDGFCCSGCARVYEVLAGLDEEAGAKYLEAARRMGLIPESDQGPAPKPVAEEVGESAAVKEGRFDLSGQVCPSCAWVAERILESRPGVVEARVDFFSGSAAVSYDMRRTSPDDLNEFLGPFGYALTARTHGARAAISRSDTFRFVVCGVLFVNVMSLASIRYFEHFGMVDDAPDFLPWFELVLTLPILALGHLPMVRRAWAGLRARAITMDFLLALAVAAAFLLSLTAMLTGRSDIYFETCAGLVTINLLGRMIEARLRERAHADLETLMRLPVTRVRVVGDDDEITYVPVEEVETGTLVLFEAGELTPFDGEAGSDEVLLSEAVLTGEPTPRRKVRGDHVVAGSRVVEGELRLCVGRRYGETTLGQIATSVGEALQSAQGRLRSADRISAWFAPAVLIVAFGAWLVRLALGGWEEALRAEGWFPSVAVLAVACPCAFSLAGVSAITAATGSLLRRGLLVKETEQLERLCRVTRVIFDKTGTLTRGEMSVAGLHWRDAPRPELLAHLFTAEQESLHPIAQAIRAWLRAEGVEEVDSAEGVWEEVPGQGRRLTLAAGEFRVGSALLFPDRFPLVEVTEQHSIAWFGFDGVAEGCLLLTDALKPEAAAVVRAIEAQGCTTEILSGDRPDATSWVARQVGVTEAHGGVSLEEKVERVRERRHAGEHVAYVGDGTNDALAMSEAEISVAVARSTDEALAASGFVLLHDDISELPLLLAAGRKLRRVIGTNYVWAFLFNTLFVPFAAAGYLVPLVAMLLMLVSSTAVLLNSLRLRERHLDPAASG